jgi:hypothetical protein
MLHQQKYGAARQFWASVDYYCLHNAVRLLVCDYTAAVVLA